MELKCQDFNRENMGTATKGKEKRMYIESDFYPQPLPV